MNDTKARLDEDERIARAAGGDTWRATSDGIFHEDVSTQPGPFAVGPYEWLDDEGDHIARHDPARVLADVERTRRIIAECQYVIRDSAQRDTGDGIGLAETILGILAEREAESNDGR